MRLHDDWLHLELIVAGALALVCRATAEILLLVVVVDVLVELVGGLLDGGACVLVVGGRLLLVALVRLGEDGRYAIELQEQDDGVLAREKSKLHCIEYKQVKTERLTVTDIQIK